MMHGGLKQGGTNLDIKRRNAAHLLPAMCCLPLYMYLQITIGSGAVPPLNRTSRDL